MVDTDTQATQAANVGTARAGGVLLIQFARSPLPGAVKTRMLPVLSAEQACDLHQELLLWTCRTLCESAVGDVELWVSGDLAHPAFDRCRHYGVLALRAQTGDDLGERMCNAMADGLARYEKVILVGSDCPAIDAQYLRSACSGLDSRSVVLGPADDGGYVLIGAGDLWPELFADKPWGQDSVYAQTVAALVRLQVSWLRLPSLPDIDRPEDLPLWHALRDMQPC